MRFGELRSAEDIVNLAAEVGILPFFRCGIEGYSIEESTPEELWFKKNIDGPWEWKGPCIQTGKVAYGKIIGYKAAFISLELFPILANFRRDGYDFDSLYDDGLSNIKSKRIIDALASGKTDSVSLKNKSGFGEEKGKGFDPTIALLQMQTYVTVSDFLYGRDKKGNRVGWGKAEYSLSEYMFGYDFCRERYSDKPSASRAELVSVLKKSLPDVSEIRIEKLL